jgi:hypothetical protein
MRKIYENAEAVLIWLGPDTTEPQASIAIDSILQISDFLCRKLNISVSDLSSINDVYHDVVFKNRGKLPLPHECGFATDAMWSSLRWLYSHPYFTRVWVIQEINANKQRLLHCGRDKIEWDRVHLVAGYMMMETAWSKTFGFSDTYCWWVATMSTELISHRHNWLHMLYLASNFSCTDPRDLIFGLRGLMIVPHGAELLRPDYSKSTIEVYRDSVEAAFTNFQHANVLLYASGNEEPSWVPRWNQSMLFRNPFRFGKAVPWKPAGETKAKWRIDKSPDVLYLTGFIVDSIKSVERYNESFFGNAMAESDEGKTQLKQVWQKVLKLMSDNGTQQLNRGLLTAAATSLSFGLDENTNPADERYLLHNFLAYLRTTVGEETYNKYIPLDVAGEAKDGDSRAFGKPVWGFEYPESSFFVTERSLIGCSTSTNRSGDIVFVALGSTYPFILRPHDGHFHLKGFTYVHGIMHGELRNSAVQVLALR